MKLNVAVALTEKKKKLYFAGAKFEKRRCGCTKYFSQQNVMSK